MIIIRYETKEVVFWHYEDGKLMKFDMNENRIFRSNFDRLTEVREKVVPAYKNDNWTLVFDSGEP